MHDLHARALTTQCRHEGGRGLQLVGVRAATTVGEPCDPCPIPTYGILSLRCGILDRRESATDIYLMHDASQGRYARDDSRRRPRRNRSAGRRGRPHTSARASLPSAGCRLAPPAACPRPLSPLALFALRINHPMHKARGRAPLRYGPDQRAAMLIILLPRLHRIPRPCAVTLTLDGVCACLTL